MKYVVQYKVLNSRRNLWLENDFTFSGDYATSSEFASYEEAEKAAKLCLSHNRDLDLIIIAEMGDV